MTTTPETPATNDSAPEPVPVQTAFLVYLTPDGTWIGNWDINTPVVPERPAGPDDMKAGCSCVVLDAQTGEIAQQTAMTVMAMLAGAGRQMQVAMGGPPVPGDMNIPGGVPLLTGSR